MFFNNALMYRLTQALAIDPETLEQALAAKPAREPGTQEMATYGFIAPFGKGPNAPLVHASHGFMLIAARKAERNLPGNVVREEVKTRVERIEENQCRKVYKKERDQIKDEVIQAFLPHAFIKRKVTFAAIDLEAGLIIVQAASPGQAEDLLSTLREVLGTLPVRPVTTKLAPVATLTEWLTKQKAAADFFVLDECVMHDTHEDGGTATLKRQDLTAEETQLHLQTGKVVTKLSLAWQDKLSFVLDDKFTIKRLKFEDLLKDQAENDGGDDAIGQLDASFVLMMLTFRLFIPALIEAMGGEEIPDGLGFEKAFDAVLDVRPVVEKKKPRERRPEVQLDAFEEEPAAHPAPLPGEEDQLFREAAAWVIKENKVSISGVQRKYLIGYNRAARLIERMEECGVIERMGSDGKRLVLMNSIQELAA